MAKQPNHRAKQPNHRVVALSDATHERLREVAAAEGRTMGHVMERALDKYFDRHTTVEEMMLRLETLEKTIGQSHG